MALTRAGTCAILTGLAPDETAEDPRHARLGVGLLLLAVAVLLVAGLRNLGDPWDGGMRGSAAAMYSDGAVTHTLRYGLGVTQGMPAFITEVDGELVREVNWHHPPGYWLYLSGCAWVFGHQPSVLRLAQLLLFLPGIFALFALVRRRVGSLPAGVTALLFATTPLVAYFGPMVLQDGAVLGFGLMTLWSFQRHLDAPSWGAWLLTAGLFFLTASIDYPGYFWGMAMFVLALGSSARLSAVGWVFTFFPVSVLAFAVMAVHYGMLFGGPGGFLAQLVEVLTHEAETVEVPVSRLWGSAHELLIAHGNLPIVAMAAIGLVCGVAHGAATTRRMLWLGLAMSIPGVLSYALMFNHALDHVFWSMNSFAGLACLATISAMTGWRWCRQHSRALRNGGRVLLLATALSIAGGAYWTHVVISRFVFEDNGTYALMSKALPLLIGCTRTLTSARAVPQVYFGHTQLWADINTPEKIDISLELGRIINARGLLGFVVHPDHRNTALTKHLDTMAEVQIIDDVWVYILKL